MKLFYIATLAPLTFFAHVGAVQAKPHCFADVQISDGSRIVTANKIWDKRTNGKRWWQHLGNHRAECNSLGANHFSSLDLTAFAAANRMCGTITAKGSSWIGTSNKRGRLGPKTIEVPCEVDVEGKVKADYQYSSKVACGKPEKEILHSGTYKAVVNVHNPGYDDVEFRFKFAGAKRGKDGPISYFTESEIGSDGAQLFDCAAIHKIANDNSFLDGFFVIESREPLDVVTYYTGGDNKIATLDVEATKERQIQDNRRWSCGAGREFLTRAQGWTVNGQSATWATQFSGSPIFQSGTYEHGGIDGWLSDRTNLTSAQLGGNYNYRLPFCLCNEQEYPTSAQINVTALRGDNAVTANVDNSTAFITGQNAYDQVPAGSGSVSVTGSGQHFLEFALRNDEALQAVGMGGTISLQNGYIGICK